VGNVTFIDVSTRIPTNESKPTDKIASLVFKVTVLGWDTINTPYKNNWRILDSSPSPIVGGKNQ
jgi:hypothetical protein